MDEFDEYLELTSVSNYKDLFSNDPYLNDDDPERFEIKILITIASFIQSKQTIHDKLEAKLDELLQIMEQKEKAYKK